MTHCSDRDAREAHTLTHTRASVCLCVSQATHGFSHGYERQLMATIGRIDIDQHGTDLEACERHHDPLGAVLHPDADAAALRDAEAQEPARHGIDLLVELQPRPRDVLFDYAEHTLVRVGRHAAFEPSSDRCIAHQRLVLGAAHPRQRHSRSIGLDGSSRRTRRAPVLERHSTDRRTYRYGSACYCRTSHSNNE